jgi:hypothetical protein
MQPLAIYVLASGVAMILGVSATLVMARHEVKHRRNAINR